MTLSIRSYKREDDFDKVSRFLIDSYRPGDTFTPWLQGRWEYMHYMTDFQRLNLAKIGIAEEQGEIIGVVNFESNEAEVFIQAHPDRPEVRFDLFEYAEQVNYSGISRSTGRLFRVVFVNDFDAEMEQLVQQRGYEKWEKFGEENSCLLLDTPLPEYSLPESFKLQSLAEENDLHKINRVLWRGFNHPGPPPEEEVAGRAYAQQAPNFRKDLTMVAVAPDGNYASFGGMWHIKQNKVAMVEPVATDPDYRRMGLGKAVVLESVRRAAAEGARVAWVGSGQEFYKAIGFETIFTVYPWAKFLD